MLFLDRYGSTMLLKCIFLFKTGQITPEAVLKNHNKSQKNHKNEKSNCVGFQISSYTQ
jgi:hypothetical protein